MINDKDFLGMIYYNKLERSRDPCSTSQFAEGMNENFREFRVNDRGLLSELNIELIKIHKNFHANFLMQVSQDPK